MRLDPRPHLRVHAPPVTGHWPLVTHHPPRYAYLGPSCSCVLQDMLLPQGPRVL